MKRVGYLNKEIRCLEEEGYQFWPMETQADWLKTRCRLASLFSNFALSRNDYIKVWTGYRVASEHIRMSLTKFHFLQSRHSDCKLITNIFFRMGWVPTVANNYQ